jgi:hypothetical protein
MSKRFVMSACVWLASCAVEQPGEGDHADRVPAVDNVARIGSNSMSPEALARAAVTTDRLDGAAAATLGATEDGRMVLHYAVGCALDGDQSITVLADGVEYTMAGAMGLAPDWTASALSTTQAAWVSACMFARVNLTSTPVTISARGSTPSLEASTVELNDYRIEEGAFWGNAFADLGSVIGYSCDGVDQAADDSHGDLPLRQCAQPDGPGSDISPCGLHYAGLCSDVCTTAGTYTNCAMPGKPPAVEVITTMLYGAPE